MASALPAHQLCRGLPTQVDVTSFPFLTSAYPATFMASGQLPAKPPLPTPPAYSLRPASFQLLPPPPVSGEVLEGMTDAMLRAGKEVVDSVLNPVPRSNICVAALIPKTSTPIVPLPDDSAAPEPDAHVRYSDIWEDLAVLQYLQHKTLPANTPAEEARIKRRAAAYLWREGKLYRLLSQSSQREVPPPASRQQLVEETHQRTGHQLLVAWHDQHGR